MNNQKFIKIIPVALGVAISAVLIIAFVLISGVFTRASDYEPRDVIISNIEQNSARISWTTSIETQGVIEYGTTPTALNFFAPEPQRTKNHSVDLTLLSPSTTYYFQIRISDKKYDNGGVPWTFATKASGRSQISTPRPVMTIANTPTITQSSPTPLKKITIQASPTPLQKLKIVDNQTSKEECSEESDCTKIKQKLGKGCTTQDYFRCLRKLTPTLSLTPTISVILTPTPSATVSPTLSQ